MKRKRSTGRRTDATDLTESDFAQQKMGRNSLQGDDQSNVRNQRHAVPEPREDADDGVIETLEKSDKNVRAKREFGKGRRH